MTDHEQTAAIIKLKADVAQALEKLEHIEQQLRDRDDMTKEIRELTSTTNLLIQRWDIQQGIIEDRFKRIEHGNTERGRRLGDVEKAVAMLSGVPETMGKIELRLEALAAKPGKNWEKLVWLIAGFLVSAVGALVVTALTK